MELKSISAVGAIALLLALGCEDETRTIVRERCNDDSQCLEGEVCEDGECKPRDAVSCQVVEGGLPILQPGDQVVRFGDVGPATSERTLTLRNIGDCTLTVFDAYFENEDDPPFECPGCMPDQFPVELFPFRDMELGIFFTPVQDTVGEFRDTLILLSDDTEFPEIRVPVIASFTGVPEVRSVPAEVDFGFAPVGRTLTQQIQISNHGSGTAELIIQDIELTPTGTTAFSYEPEFDGPFELEPISIDQNSFHTITLKYHPKEIGVHTGELVVSTNQLSGGTLVVPVKGTSKTPPKITVSPERIEFGSVPLGQTTAQILTIVNGGGSPLVVTYRWGATGFTTDLSASPVLVPPIEPGQFTEMQVFVTATAPGPIQGLLIFETNDPNKPSISIPVSATGDDIIAGTQVLKVDMNFENGDDSFFDDDLRNVDMSLESPFGLICNKQNPNPSWGPHGDPSWLAFGVTEEPERIVLPNAMQDGTYRLIVNYIEDCASVPTALVAAVLGISVEALIAYFTGGTTGGITGGAVSDAIESLCLDHDSSAVTLTVSVNGQIIAEVPSRVGRKGDFVYAADLLFSNGTFTVQ